jgi:hypothetical protein
MATPQQIAANRQNAQKSTGPRTPEGKAASSQNAFKSGLDADSQFCYGEQRADFYRLQVEYFTRFSPQSPEERFHVDTLIRNEWSLRRLFRAEAHLWEFNTTHASCRDGSPLGEGFNNSSPVFMRLHRRITLFEKSFEASLTKLKELREDRIASGEVPARATEEELTYPGHTVHVFDDPGQPPEIIFVPEDPETVGQALPPGPNRLVHLPLFSTQPAESTTVTTEIGFVPSIASKSALTSTLPVL